MRHSACNGLYLFTFTVKFRIRDSVHPLSRSWNSSSDVRIGYWPHATRAILANRANGRVAFRNVIVSRTHTFIRTFITRYKFTIKHCVYLNIIMSLHYTLHMFHYFSRICRKLARLDVSRVYHCTGQYTAFKRFHAIEVPRCIRHPLAQNVHAPNPLNFWLARYEQSTIVWSQSIIVDV